MVEGDGTHGIEETAGTINTAVEGVPDAVTDLASAKDKERQVLRGTMHQLEAARDRIGPYCITLGSDVEGGMFPCRRAILLTVPDRIIEGDGDNRRAINVWTVVTEEGFFSLLTPTSSEEVPEVPKHLLETDKVMYGFVAHAQRYLNGVSTRSTGLSMGQKQHVSVRFPRYARETSPNAAMINETFYLDSRDVRVPDHDTVVEAVERNIDAALQPLVASRGLAEQTTGTAEEATRVVLDRLSGFSSDVTMSSDEPDTTGDLTQ